MWLSTRRQSQSRPSVSLMRTPPPKLSTYSRSAAVHGDFKSLRRHIENQVVSGDLGSQLTRPYSRRRVGGGWAARRLGRDVPEIARRRAKHLSDLLLAEDVTAANLDQARENLRPLVEIRRITRLRVRVTPRRQQQATQIRVRVRILAAGV